MPVYQTIKRHNYPIYVICLLYLVYVHAIKDEYWPRNHLSTYTLICMHGWTMFSKVITMPSSNFVH